MLCDMDQGRSDISGCARGFSRASYRRKFAARRTLVVWLGSAICPFRVVFGYLRLPDELYPVRFPLLPQSVSRPSLRPLGAFPVGNRKACWKSRHALPIRPRHG